MKTSNKLTCLALLLSVSMSGYTAASKQDKEDKDNKNPVGCNNTGYEFDLKTLHLLPESVGAKQSMYFIFNTLATPINLYQMRDDESSRSLYLNHIIRAGQWGVMSSSEKIVKFICTVPDPKLRYGKIVDCADVIRVCEYTNVKYGLNNRGNFWIVNSNTRNAAVREVVRYGIIPDKKEKKVDKKEEG